MASDIDILFKQARELRLGNRIQDAFHLVNQALASNMQHAGLLTEALKIVLALESQDQARSIWGALRNHPEAKDFFETGFLLRVGQLLQEHPLPEMTKIEFSQGSWVKIFLKTGEDKEESFSIDRLTMAIHNGITKFVFHGNCPDCDNRSLMDVETSLFQFRQFFCQSCFVRLTLDPLNMTSFIKENRKDLIDPQLLSYDKKLSALQERIGKHRAEEIPALCRYQNQQLIGYLGELIMRRMELKD